MYATKFEDFPAEVRHKARLALFDGIGCYSSGARHPADCGDALALAAVYGDMGFWEAHREELVNDPQVKGIRGRIMVQPGMTGGKPGTGCTPWLLSRRRMAGS